MSMTVAGRSIALALDRGAEVSLVLTDGFSCAMQGSQIAPDRASTHLAIVLGPDAARDGEADQ